MLRALALSLLPLLFACQASISDPPNDVANRSSEFDPAEFDPTDCEASIGSGSAPLRRLTRTEYERTVEGLLGYRGSATAAFVPDEQSGAFESNVVSPISELAVSQYAMAAEEIARASVDAALEMAPCDPTVEGDEACANEFVSGVGLRMYRRPLTDPELTRFLELFGEQRAISDFNGAARVVLSAMLQSPHFVYHSVASDPSSGRLTDYSHASRIAFLIWRSAPDLLLLEAAGRGELSTAQGVQDQVDRLLNDERALSMLTDFHFQWLGLRKLNRVSPEGLDDELRQSLRDETDTFVRAVMSDSATVGELLTATYSFPDQDVASLYGVEAGGADRVELDPELRSGILTHPSVLTTHHNPITRGRFIREVMLCEDAPVMPCIMDQELVMAPQGVSPREKWEVHSSNPGCRGCHERFDSIGFGFDEFDELGRHRTEFPGGFPIDSTGEVIETREIDGTFSSVPELGARLAESEEVMECISQQWIRFALGRTLEGADGCLIYEAHQHFRDSDYNVRELVTAIATSPRFRITGVQP